MANELVTKLRLDAVVNGVNEVRKLGAEVENVQAQASKPTPDSTAALKTGAKQAEANVHALSVALQDLGVSEAKAQGMASGMAEEIGNLNSAEQKVESLRQAFIRLGASEQNAGKLAQATLENLNGNLNKTTGIASGLTQQLGALLTIGALKRFVDDSMREYGRAESAYRGLEAIATHAGVSIGKAMAEAQRLAADGLISVADASKALQNLLSRGYGLDQAVEVISRLKDAAAFNRQANLSMSEAVVTATEGLKNENSVLVDNAGVTKNVAKMWEDYANAQGITATSMTTAQKIQAEYNGIMAETEAQVGNAAVALQGYQGQMAQVGTEVDKFNASFGQVLAPTIQGLATGGIWLLDNVVKPLVFLFQGLGIEVGRDVRVISILWDAIKHLDFSNVSEKIRLANQEVEDMATQLAGKLDTGNLNIEPIAKTNKQALNEVGQAAEASGKKQVQAYSEVKKQMDDTQKALKTTITDYEKLGDALQQALQKSEAAIQNYRDKALQLRREADKQSLSGDSQGSISIKSATAVVALRQALSELQSLDANQASLSDLQAKYKSVDDLVQRVQDLAGATQDVQEKSDLQQQSDQAAAKAKSALANAYEREAKTEESNSKAIKEQIQQNNDRLNSYKELLAYVEGEKTLTLKTEATQAIQTIDEVKRNLDGLPLEKTIDIKALVSGLGGTSIPGKAQGGPITGPGTIGVDSQLILAAPEEHMWTAPEVAAAGGHAAMYRLRKAVLSGALRGFAQGGAIKPGAMVMRSLAAFPAASSASGQAAEFPNLGRIDLGLGERTVSVYAAPDVAATLRREVRKQGRR